MMSQELNDQITRIGPGTGAGRVLRQYWQPAALSDELMGARPVVPVRLMGEDLVLFRDEGGTLGLIGRHCPHRGADLAYGRDCLGLYGRRRPAADGAVRLFSRA
jgi:hypothetical protein